MSIVSAKNNLTKAAKMDVKNAERAVFYLKYLRAEMGRTEQSLLCSLVVQGVETLPEFAKYKASVKKAFSEFKNRDSHE